MKVAILGCGPAGLLAAHAAQIRGAEWDIYSRKMYSEIRGAQFLHRAIQGITDEEPDGQITFVHLGSRSGYARKIYGDPDAPCSWDVYSSGEHPAWSLVTAYSRLWEGYGPDVQDVEIDNDFLKWLVNPSQKYDMIFSTVPLPVLGGPVYDYVSQEVWIQQQLPEDVEIPRLWHGHDVIIYNGWPEHRWYRCSNVFGWASTEFPAEVEGAIKIRKPLRTNCDAWSNIIKVGRYGSWEKTGLVHHAFEEVMTRLDTP